MATNKQEQVQKEKYSVRSVYYVRFGESNPFAEDSIKKGVIKFSYNEISHTDCLEMTKRTVGIIDNIREQIGQVYNCNDDEITSHLQQISLFYVYSENALFITIYQGNVWFCLGGDTIILNADKTKERSTVDGWKNTDINGNSLMLSDFSKTIQFDTYTSEINIPKENDKRFILSKINADKYNPVHIDTSKVWSDELKKETRDAISNGRSPVYYMKGINSEDEEKYGMLSLIDAGKSGTYTIKLADSDKSEYFESVTDLLNAGWAID